MTKAKVNVGAMKGDWRPIERPPSQPCRTGFYTGPHNRCGHATALPFGYHRCAGDKGCPYRLLHSSLCRWHAAG